MLSCADIFNGQDMIDNVLIPQKDRFQRALAQLKANIEENRKILNEDTVNRKKQHEEFLSHGTASGLFVPSR